MRTYTPDGDNNKTLFSKDGEEIFVEDLNVNTVTINKNFQSKFKKGYVFIYG